MVTLHNVMAVTVKPVFFTCSSFREFHEPGKFAKITGRKNLNTVAFQCSRKQKCQNYGVQNNYIDSNAKIKGSSVFCVIHSFHCEWHSHDMGQRCCVGQQR